MFDIIICAYNKLSVTKKCIESVTKNTASAGYGLYLIDDGSSDETGQFFMEYACKHDNTFAYSSFENKGYVKSACLGVEEAMRGSDNPYLFLLNNDVIINKEWDSGAIEMLKDKKIGAIGAYGCKENVGGETIQFISGSRLIVKKSVVSEIGFYDKNFIRGYWEDVDFSRRVQKAGYEIKKYGFFEKHSVHTCNTSFKQLKDRNKYFKMNYEYLVDKIRKEHGEH